MDNAGIIVAVAAGSSVGLLGGIIGTWATIRNTNGPKERAFAVRASIAGWIVMFAMLAPLLLMKSDWRFLVWIPYSICLPLGIRWWNRKQNEYRAQDERDRNEGRT